MQAGSTLVFDDVSPDPGMTVIGTTSQEDDELNAGLKKIQLVIATPVDAETGDAFTMQLSDSITCSLAKIAECGESAYSILNFTVVGQGNIPFAIVSLMIISFSVFALGMQLMALE